LGWTWRRDRYRPAPQMGNLNFFGGAEADDEEQEAQALDNWRPQSEANAHAGLKRKKLSSKSSESSEDDDGGSVSEDGASSDASEQESAGGSSQGDKDSDKDQGSQKSGSSKGDDDQSSDAESEADKQADMLQKQRDAKRKKKIVVRMDFEPLLSLHEPLAQIIEEPADLFAQRKGKKHQRSADQAAIDDAQAANRNKAKLAAEWLMDMGLDDCILKELAQSLGEDPDELKYSIVQSGRFTVDEDGNVKRTMLQKIFDCMESDVETFREVNDKLVDQGEDEHGIDQAMRDAIRGSLGELRLKTANDVELLEHVDLEAEAADQRMEERESRAREKEAKQRKRGRTSGVGDDDEESSDDEDGDFGMNKEAERRALAFRRVQVQKKIEDFLRMYTKGQNLIKISKGKKYHRRVYVDTTKKSLVIQGATGPKLYAFAKMKEVDMDTRTTPEGRVENLVICAIENQGRITKELILVFPDQSKANNFVNCVTLFMAALRPHGKHK